MTLLDLLTELKLERTLTYSNRFHYGYRGVFLASQPESCVTDVLIVGSTGEKLAMFQVQDRDDLSADDVAQVLASFAGWDVGDPTSFVRRRKLALLSEPS